MSLVGEQVGDAAKPLGADGQLEGGDAGTEAVTELVERALEGGALAVELVDEDHAGEPMPAAAAPQALVLHLDPRRRRSRRTPPGRRPGGGEGLGLEVGVARACR
jgi:hypothetical protein